MEVREDELDLDLTGTAADDAPLATLNPALGRVLANLMQVASSAVPVLVRGATGTGKELIVRAVHRRAERGGRFVAVNCGALPATLMTSELFGVRRGAYSGAGEDRPGLVRSADGGTLFLDEIAELPLEAQAALLRVLQEGEVVPLGSNKAVEVDVKVVAATHRDLRALVERGEFREDLYARVAGYEVELPPLKERREDIGLILGTLLEREGRVAATLAPEAARALFTYLWPRNIRELEHLLLSALAVAGEGPIGLEHLSESVRTAARFTPVMPTTEVDGRFLELVREHAGNVSAIARVLGTSRSQVRRIADRLGVDITAFRSR
jgi:transcriptional regulator with PAS, ATPase and Fis domain